MTHDQLALLRSIAAAKPTPKALLSRQLASSSAMTTAYSAADSRLSSAAGVSLPPKHRHSDTFASSTPTRASSLQVTPTEAGGGQRSQQRAKILGGFKSGSAQLEVELVERLNEIDRSKVRLVKGWSLSQSTHGLFGAVCCSEAEREGGVSIPRVPESAGCRDPPRRGLSAGVLHAAAVLRHSQLIPSLRSLQPLA